MMTKMMTKTFERLPTSRVLFGVGDPFLAFWLFVNARGRKKGVSVDTMMTKI